MRIRLILALCALGAAVCSYAAGRSSQEHTVPAAWPKRVVLDDRFSTPTNAWVQRQLPQAHLLLVGRIQMDVSDEYRGDFATDKVPAAFGGKPLLIFPYDQFAHDALKQAAVHWFVPARRCVTVLELDARILHLRHYVEQRADGKVRVVIRVHTAVTAKWGRQGIVSGRYEGYSASAWMPPARTRYQRFAYPDNLFYPSLYGRVLQAALQKAFGLAMNGLTSFLRAKPDLRCAKLFR
jgi:hypothetical protein